MFVGSENKQYIETKHRVTIYICMFSQLHTEQTVTIFAQNGTHKSQPQSTAECNR